jgi:hypothetical protein
MQPFGYEYIALQLGSYGPTLFSGRALVGGFRFEPRYDLIQRLDLARLEHGCSPVGDHTAAVPVDVNSAFLDGTVIRFLHQTHRGARLLVPQAGRGAMRRLRKASSTINRRLSSLDFQSQMVFVEYRVGSEFAN